MKKLMIIILALACLLTLAACPADDDNHTPPAGKTYTATATAPDGWAKFEQDTYSLFRYRKGSDADFWSRKPTYATNIDEEIADYKETEEQSGFTFVWDAVKDATVNTYAAKNLNYTATSPGGLKLQYNVYFVPKDTYIFIVVCLAEDAVFAEYSADFQALLSSFTITELNANE